MQNNCSITKPAFSENKIFIGILPSRFKLLWSRHNFFKIRYCSYEFIFHLYFIIESIREVRIIRPRIHLKPIRLIYLPVDISMFRFEARQGFAQINLISFFDAKFLQKRVSRPFKSQTLNLIDRSFDITISLRFSNRNQDSVSVHH